MSYLVCHIQKFKSSDVKGLQIHNQRESKNSKNTDIDQEKTRLNYDLHNSRSINYNNKVKERIKEGYKGTRAVRKDAVVMCSTLVTSDSDFFKNLPLEKQKEFFQESYEYFKDRYGEGNIISASVHFDEKTPHMHLCSIPLTEEGKLSAKTLLDRKSLREIQDQLPKYLQGKGFKVERGREGSENKHIEINEFKKKTVEKLERDLEARKSVLKDKIIDLDLALHRGAKIERINAKESLLGDKVTLSKVDYNQLLNLAQNGVYKGQELKDLERELSALREKAKRLEKINTELSSEYIKYKGLAMKREEYNSKLLGQAKAMNTVIEKHNLKDEFIDEYYKANSMARVNTKSRDLER